MMVAKIFCIGFHKTGTTSLGGALKTLGYRVTGPNGVRDPDISRNVISMAHALVREYDAFQDNPWPIIYREMDDAYPKSKFILTLRDPHSWIQSQLRHFGNQETPMREWIYGFGCPQGNEDVYMDRFESHNQEVRNYFRLRGEDLLIMDLFQGHGWRELCTFLGVEIPDQGFPHANRAEDRERASKRGGRLRRNVSRILTRLRQDGLILGPTARRDSDRDG